MQFFLFHIEKYFNKIIFVFLLVYENILTAKKSIYGIYFIITVNNNRTLYYYNG